MDYDGDGRTDLLSGSIGGKIHLFRRKPNGTFAAGETVKKNLAALGAGRDLAVGSGSSVCAADWFKRGKLDLIVGNGEGAVYLLENEGTRQQPRYNQLRPLKAAGKPILADGGAAGPYVFDWDGDGLQDLLLGCGSGSVIWYRNNGSPEEPSLAAGVTLVARCNEEAGTASSGPPKRSSQYAKICPFDWDGDGRPDLVVGDRELIRRDDRSYSVHGWVWVYLQKPAPVETGQVDRGSGPGQ